MKTRFLYVIIFLFTISNFAQTNTCGITVNNTFSTPGDLPEGWTEYNTSGRVTVEAGKLKFDHNTYMPSVYHTFSPTSNNPTFSFDVSATRNSVNCRIHLVSSTGKHLSSIAIGIGTATIKYATAMESGVPSSFVSSTPAVSFPTNTVFTISTQVDFDSKKVNFYSNGELMATDIPFLEDAEDITKIDIQLIYMYANNGQFYFDNISLLSGEENRLLLTNNINAAESLLESVTIGTAYNQYPQSAANAFQLVIDDAIAVIADCESTSATIDSSISNLELAQEVFLASRVNDPVLKIYSGYDFSGEEHEIYCGYYNGTLGAYDDWAVSFTLEKGYMATFAENINGTGASKVYVAAEDDLSINLTQDLQKKASFIRVSPWNDVHKKGASGKGNDVVAALNSTWFYDWGNGDVSTSDTEYVVMNWSGGGGIDKMESLGSIMDVTHHLAFNEPDGSNQANMTVDNAIAQYKILQASGLRLGAPAVTDGAKGRAWLDEFMEKAIAAGYRIDYLPVHYYKKPTTTSFYNWLKNLYDTYQIPLWITEFNYGDIHDNPNLTESQVLAGLTSFINMLDDTYFVERYCVFTWQPSQTPGGGHSLMSVRNPVTLNSVGEFYANHESPVAYTQETYEQGEPLSTNDNSISSQVLLSPTVITDGFFNLKYSDEIKSNDIELTIYNTAGQLVKQVSGLSPKIDVNRLSSGLYIVKITSGLRYFTEKIIIQ
ncbi:glycosyl hydrolase [Flavivirga aquimarina]|uniref:Glycosyl hydrolase n=1 Tax=Flavivirga aquimarina TaxID=2027862 RepID=A0ABT8W6L0_9FLAO|nr:glycosyl hydrolase [Flavivirga aquimarina]MDO5968709.1 glycosyl hydrolase [Flavivirga aquimarina]